MRQIVSRANPIYRDLLAQARVAGRPGHAVLLEGPHLCQAWLAFRGQPTWLVFAAGHDHQPAVQQLRQAVRIERQLELDDRLFAALSSVKTHQGVLFVVEPVEEPSLLAWVSNTVLLDQVQDPGNVGTILRTCAAAGIEQVVTSRGTAACWSAKVLRSAQGAHFALRIHEGHDLLTLLQQQRQSADRLPILATALEAAESLFGVKLPARAIWLFGNEGQGVSPELLALADRRVCIDIDRQAVESLNVASAVAVCLFEQRRQRTRALSSQ